MGDSYSMLTNKRIMNHDADVGLVKMIHDEVRKAIYAMGESDQYSLPDWMNNK